MQRISLFIASLFSVASVFAGGFYAPEIASPGSIGTAGAANPTNIYDASAAVTNPTGRLYLEGETRTRMGLQLMAPVTRFKADAATTVAGDNGGNSGVDTVIPGFFVAHHISPDFSVGAAMSAKMGGGLDYGRNFYGRYQMISGGFSGVGITGSAAYRLTDQVAIGGGVSAIYNRLDVDIAVDRCPFIAGPCTPSVHTDGQLEFDKLDSWAPQLTLNVMYDFAEDWALGFVYRSKVDVDIKGDMNISPNLVGTPLESQQGPLKIAFDAPEVFQVGLRHNVSDNWVWFAEADWERFSQFSNNTLVINGGIVEQRDRDWDDTWRVSTGVIQFRGNTMIAAGIGYDSSPVSDHKRTFDLPLDEQLRLAFAIDTIQGDVSYSLAAETIWMGNAKIRQQSPVDPSQTVVGEFATNYIFVLSGSVEYKF